MNAAASKHLAWLEAQALAFGTDDQRDRWSAKCLPEDELLALARNELFRPLEGMARWKRIEVGEIRHLTHMRLGCSGDTIEFHTSTPPAVMDSQQWALLNRIKRAVETINRHEWMKRDEVFCEVLATAHVAECARCKSVVARMSASVRIPWAGRTLVREYAL